VTEERTIDEVPRMTAAEKLDRRLARLSPEKRAVLEQRLLDRRDGAGVGTTAIPRRGDDGAAPLSITQELLWLVQQLDPNSHVYNSSGVRRLTGPLDVQALRSAFDAVVARHESLRTTFRTLDGEPVQIVSKRTRADFEFTDLSSRDEEALGVELQSLIDAEIRHPFDLTRDPLLRTRLIRLAEGEHMLVTVGHHIAWDGWSKGILYRELAVLYDALVRNAPPALEPLPIQYADFAVWQRRWLESGGADGQLDYWRQQLTGAPALLELPADRPRPPDQRHRGARQSLWLPPVVLEQLRSFSRAESGTLFMTLVGALAVLLHRYSGQDDILIGTPIAGRNRTEIENLIGYFTNTLVLRTDLSGDPSFRELFARVRQAALGAFANQDAPFERLVRELAHERSASYSPLFQVMLVLQNQTSETLEFSGVRMSMVRTDPRTSKFDLTIGVGERPEGLHASFEYDTDLFEGETVARMRGHFRTLLEGVLADPERRVSKLPLLTESERLQVLVEWNRDSGEAPEGTVHGLVAETARRSPGSTAAVAQGRSLTYRELEERAEALARHLVGLGLERGSAVGIFMDRGLELPVALLATLKAGAACLLLDPAYPAERLAHMLSDSGAAVVLTQAERVDDLPGDTATVLQVDADRLSIGGTQPSVELPEVASDDTAYLVYTSGSTGTPCGVELTHRGLVNHATAAVALYGLEPKDRVLQVSSISFDISIEEMLPTWFAGAAVVYLPPHTPLAGTGFLDWLTEQAITVLDLPTAYWHEWVNDLAVMRREVPDSVRTVIVGGESALASVYRTWLAVGGHRVRWFNTYGPTETSVVVTAWESDLRRPEDVPAELPIGHAIANARLYVLDGHQEPVAVGVPGELYIGGPGVALGYRGRPELTAERFVPDPYSERDDHRLYRTGDVVRRLRDGSLQFVGRTDHQIKLRGFRVEPGEVEAALAEHPRIRDAVVVPRGKGAARRLAAYVAPVRRPGPLAGELRAFLRERLPGYMVPSTFVELTALPLNPNGKVVRESLPEPEGNGGYTEARVQPRDILERSLVGLWQRLLGLDDEPGVTDDFFELGGYSLLAVRMFAEIERELGVRLQLAALFRTATVEDLAAAIRDERTRKRAPWRSLVELAPGTPGGKPLFLAPWLDGQIFGYRNLVRHLDPDQPVYGLQALGLDGRTHPHSTVEEMAAHYVQEIREVQPHGPYLLGGYCFGGAVAYEMADQLRQASEEVALLALIDAPALPFVHRRQPQKTRIELERERWSTFSRGDLRVKIAVLRRLVHGLHYKIARKLRWQAFDFLVAARLPLPRRLQSVERVNRRAVNRYTSPASSCRVTLFRIAQDVTSSFFQRSFWSSLAAGGLDVRPIASEGITHLTMMEEPHVRVLAAELNGAIADRLHGSAADAREEAMVR
jgi:amino acid adenylation domain-containing protein